jgi:hypothetical protein
MIWKYLAYSRAKKKHQLHSPTHRTAICGTSDAWYIPDHDGWKDDEEGLAIREECKRCAKGNFTKS